MGEHKHVHAAALIDTLFSQWSRRIGSLENGLIWNQEQAEKENTIW